MEDKFAYIKALKELHANKKKQNWEQQIWSVKSNLSILNSVIAWQDASDQLI